MPATTHYGMRQVLSHGNVTCALTTELNPTLQPSQERERHDERSPAKK